MGAEERYARAPSDGVSSSLYPRNHVVIAYRTSSSQSYLEKTYRDVTLVVRHRTSIMARPKWLAILTQHGEKPPAMLKFRSSDGFIIGTVALAVFTVSTHEKKLRSLVELQRMITKAYSF